MSRHVPWIALAALTALRLLVAGVTPLSPDECYYWVWAQAPAGGYLDHPPMVALWISLGTYLAGDTALGVRLLAPLSAAVGSIALVRAGSDLLGSRKRGIIAAAIMNATLLSGVGSVTMTPDTPLLLFYTLVLAALARLTATGNGAYWMVAGCMAGLAMDSKYTAVLLAPSLLIWLATSRGMLVWLGRWQVWAALPLAAAPLAGMVLWNADHAWASFAKQGGRTGAWDPSRAIGYLGELIGGQVGLATPLIALLCVAGMVLCARRFRQPSYGLLAALTVVPGLVFIEHALGDRVQANWPAILYPAASLAAAALAGRWARLVKPGIALGLALTTLVWLQAAAAPFVLPRAIDPTLMRLGGWDAFAQSIDIHLRATDSSFVAVDNYGIASELAWHLRLQVPVIGVEQRWSYFDLPTGAAATVAAKGLLIRSARRKDPPDATPWSTIQPMGEMTRSRGGETAETYLLYRVTGRAQPETVSAILPRRH